MFLCLAGSHPEAAPLSAYAHELSLLMRRLPSPVPFPRYADRVLQISLRRDVRASFAWHAARRLVSTGDGESGEQILARAREDLIGSGIGSPPEVRQLSRRANLIKSKAAFPVRAFSTLDGDTVALDPGRRAAFVVMVLDPSCALCADIAPEFARFARAHPQLRGIWLSTSKRGAERWRKRHGQPWPIGGRVQERVDLIEHLGIGGTPACALIAEDGRIVQVASGRDDVRDAKSWIARFLRRDEK